METNKETYIIAFSQRNTVSTCVSPGVKPGGSVYYLKAKTSRSSQHVGYARVLGRGRIEVSTVSGQVVGVAKTRREAAAMIDAHHREHNREQYWRWVRKTLRTGDQRP